MKTKVLLFILLLISGMVSAQVKRVAILEPIDKEGNIEYNNLVILRANLSKAVINTPGYEAYDRTDIDAIMREHTFQRTGFVSTEQIKKVGEMTGANYVLVAEVVKSGANKLFVNAKLLDVETAQTLITDNMEINIENMSHGCNALAKKMFPGKRGASKNVSSLSLSTGPQIVRNKKIDQKLLGIEEYTCNGVQMDKKQLKGFLRNNSYEVFKRYLRAENCIKTGWAFFGVGLATTLVGGGTSLVLRSMYLDKRKEFGVELWGSGTNWWNLEGSFSPTTEREKYLYEGYKYYDQQETLCIDLSIGLISSGVGLMTFVSVPLLGTGYGMRNNIHKYYNKQPNPQPKFTLNLQYSQNGLGLALNF